jgi:hypothetical protein
MAENHSLPIPWQALWLPKRGHQIEEYEDAFAGDAAAGRFAVADGASETSFAGLWARLLVAGFVQGESGADPGTSWLEPVQWRWAAEVDNQRLPWYGEAKRQQGAFATLLGLVLKKSRGLTGGPWRAKAVGDTCLFQISNNHLVKPFPLTCPGDFGNRPGLLGSRQGPESPAFPRPRKARGQWRTGDRFYLMTDALAQWFLTQQAANHQPWRVLDRLLVETQPETAFRTWIEELRNHGGLRNDDVTLLTLTL